MPKLWSGRVTKNSMLNFYINRAGKNLPEKRKRVLEKAKVELRELFKYNKL
jgi:hypothetical protein